ncbi:hypothetical protein FACUT_9062 [Fusarium acutatum]|uniref:Xylanolytic transcriptional activator regulatory domain-containing protein n=1 Tax=Fusarium acutatum TaxID=78861 RepID=A0A8H4JJ15_9HYPO|nr:hypothetical protein FACUT_9062 [Fusarium acutatum]
MDSPEAPHVHYLGFPADSIDGTTESESQDMPGVCHLSQTDNTAQPGRATEVEFSALIDGSENSWFDPFSVLDTEDWLPRLSPWDYSVGPRLDTLTCDDSRPTSTKPQAHPEADHVSAPQFGVGSHSPTNLQEYTSAEGLSTVTSTTPYSTVGRCARASSQHPIYFPKLLLSDVDIIAAENYYHVPALPGETYEKIRSFARSLHDTSSQSSGGQEFPNIVVLNSFMQLYFEFVNAQFPILHLPTFKPSPKSWMLVLAVVAVGCSHSAIRNQHEFAVPLRDLLHQALVIKLYEEHRSASDIPLFDLLNRSISVQETIERLQGSARLVAMVSVYVEEKRLLEEWHSWLFCGLRSPAVGQTQQSTGTSTPDQFMKRQLGQRFELFQGHQGLYTNTIPLTLTHLKTYHLLSLLRRVPLRFLYMYFGWMTTQRGTQTAKEELSQVIVKDKQSAREALRHAAILFRIIRTQTTTTFFDPHSLLIASLYIRVYVELEDTILKEISSNLGPSLSVTRPFRIDQDLEADSLQQWIRLGIRVPLHLAGVGILDGVESGTRVLKEAIRVLGQRAEWKVLNKSTVKVLQQVIDGIPPTIDA